MIRAHAEQARRQLEEAVIASEAACARYCASSGLAARAQMEKLAQYPAWEATVRTLAQKSVDELLDVCVCVLMRGGADKREAELHAAYTAKFDLAAADMVAFNAARKDLHGTMKVLGHALDQLALLEKQGEKPEDEPEDKPKKKAKRVKS